MEASDSGFADLARKNIRTNEIMNAITPKILDGIVNKGPQLSIKIIVEIKYPSTGLLGQV